LQDVLVLGYGASYGALRFRSESTVENVRRVGSSPSQALRNAAYHAFSTNDLRLLLGSSYAEQYVEVREPSAGSGSCGRSSRQTRPPPGMANPAATVRQQTTPRSARGIRSLSAVRARAVTRLLGWSAAIVGPTSGGVKIRPDSLYYQAEKP
jgi:hypothetical protein